MTIFKNSCQDVDVERVIKAQEYRWLKAYQHAKWEYESTRDRITQYANAQGELYPEVYYSRRLGLRGRRWRSGQGLVRVLHVSSVVDFGCATGSYLEGIVSEGVTEVLGVELNYDRMKDHIPEGIRDKIVQGHLGRYLSCGEWDCVLSLDVAEHLLPEEEDCFIENVLRASKRLIVFSASNKPGVSHFNRHTREYWIGKFTLAGCQYLKKETEELVFAWRGHRGLRYIRVGLCVFRAKGGEE